MIHSQIVSTLEETYGFDIQNREKLVVKPENEESTFSVSICNPNVETLTADIKAVIIKADNSFLMKG